MESGEDHPCHPSQTVKFSFFHYQSSSSAGTLTPWELTWIAGSIKSGFGLASTTRRLSIPDLTFPKKPVPIRVRFPSTPCVVSEYRLGPASIHDILLIGASRRLVGREKDGEPRNLVRHELPLQALTLHQF